MTLSNDNVIGQNMDVRQVGGKGLPKKNEGIALYFYGLFLFCMFIWHITSEFFELPLKLSNVANMIFPILLVFIYIIKKKINKLDWWDKFRIIILLLISFLLNLFSSISEKLSKNHFSDYKNRKKFYLASIILGIILNGILYFLLFV